MMYLSFGQRDFNTTTREIGVNLTVADYTLLWTTSVWPTIQSRRPAAKRLAFSTSETASIPRKVYFHQNPEPSGTLRARATLYAPGFIRAVAPQISRRSLPRMTGPLYPPRRTAPVHISSVISGSSVGTKCDRTSAFT